MKWPANYHQLNLKQKAELIIDRVKKDYQYFGHSVLNDIAEQVYQGLNVCENCNGEAGHHYKMDCEIDE